MFGNASHHPRCLRRWQRSILVTQPTHPALIQDRVGPGHGNKLSPFCELECVGFGGVSSQLLVPNCLEMVGDDCCADQTAIHELSGTLKAEGHWYTVREGIRGSRFGASAGFRLRRCSGISLTSALKCKASIQGQLLPRSRKTGG